MVVSMLQFIIELPEACSIKDKRRVIKSLKDRLQRKFKLSVSEVDLQEVQTGHHSLNQSYRKSHFTCQGVRYVDVN